MNCGLSEKFKVVEALTPATDAAGRTGDYVSLKNAMKAIVLCQVAQGDANTVDFSINQAEAVAGTNSKALGDHARIWVQQDCANNDTLALQTSLGDNFTTNAGVKHKMVVFEVDPATLDTANGFDCITVITGASNVGNLTSAVYLLESTYPGATPPAAITD